MTSAGSARQVQSRLTHLFRSRGYAEIITPEVEFYDSFVTGGCAIPQEAMLKVIDRSGKICVMRPDSTIPIARGGGHQAEGPAAAPALLLQSERLPVQRRQPGQRR